MKREEVNEIMSIGELFNTFKTWGMFEKFYLGYEGQISLSTELERFYVRADVNPLETRKLLILMLRDSTEHFKLIEPVERFSDKFIEFKFEKKKLS